MDDSPSLSKYYELVLIMAIYGPAFAVLVGVIPASATLLLNILVYRFGFRKYSRMRANTYSWLITAGFGFLAEIIITSIFKEQLGLAVIAMVFYAPVFGIGIPSLWALIRFIFIKVTPKKERQLVQKTPEPKLE